MQKSFSKEIIIVYFLITLITINARLYRIPYRNSDSTSIGYDDDNLEYDYLDSNNQRRKDQLPFDSYEPNRVKPQYYSDDQNLHQPHRGKTRYFSETNSIDDEYDDDDSPYILDPTTLARTTTARPIRKKFFAKKKLPHYSMWDLTR